MAQHGCLVHLLPQLAPFGQRPLALAAYKVVGRIVQLPYQQRHDVALAVDDIYVQRLRQPQCLLCHPFIDLNPAPALEHARAHAIFERYAVV